MTIELTNAMDVIRNSLNGSINRSERSKIGQFLTPARIARFMASLFEQKREHARILDPGAGAGVLFSAYVEAFISGKQRPRSIDGHHAHDGVLC